MGSFLQEAPDLLPLLLLLPFSALSAGFRVALEVASGGVVALEVASSPPVLPPAFALFVALSPPVALVASSVGLFRKVIFVPDLSSARSASIPAATSKGSTSLIRLHSQRADFGHALSLSTSTPSVAATILSLLCISEDVAVYSSLSSMNLIMACATGDPSSVAWFCVRTTSSQSFKNVSAPHPRTSYTVAAYSPQSASLGLRDNLMDGLSAIAFESMSNRAPSRAGCSRAKSSHICSSVFLS